MTSLLSQVLVVSQRALVDVLQHHHHYCKIVSDCTFFLYISSQISNPTLQWIQHHRQSHGLEDTVYYLPLLQSRSAHCALEV